MSGLAVEIERKKSGKDEIKCNQEVEPAPLFPAAIRHLFHSRGAELLTRGTQGEQGGIIIISTQACLMSAMGRYSCNFFKGR